MEKDINYLLTFGRKHGFGAPKKARTGGGSSRLGTLPAVGTRVSLTEQIPGGVTIWTTGTVVDHIDLNVEDGNGNIITQENACIIPDGTTMANARVDERGRIIPREFTYTLGEINGFIDLDEFVILDDNQNKSRNGVLSTGNARTAGLNNEIRKKTFEYYEEFKAYELEKEAGLMAEAAAARAFAEEEAERLAQEEEALAEAEEAEPETVVYVDNDIEEEVFTLFMVMDMYKDFISNFDSKEFEKKQQGQGEYTPGTRTNYATKEDMLKQKGLLIGFLKEYIRVNVEFFSKHSELNKLMVQFIAQNERKSGAAVSVSPELEVEINKLLGVQLYFPRQMMDKLFPGILDPDDLFTQFMRFLKVATNNVQEDSFKYLRRISDYYKEESIEVGSRQNLREELESQLRATLREYSIPKETMAWIEASSGVKKIPKTLGLIEYLNQRGMLTSIKSPGSILDSAGIENDIVRLASNSGKYIDFKLDRPVVKFLVKSKSEKTLADLFLKKQKNVYTLEINDFFGLDCKKFGDPLVNAQDPKTKKISRQSVWDILISLFNGRGRRYDEFKEDPISFMELDLCIKSNKTAMDMLKSFFAKKYSDEHPAGDLISVYNDKNAARFMGSINKKGFVIFYSSITPDILKGETEERVVIRDEFSDILFAETVQEQLNMQGSQCLDEQCETPPPPAVQGDYEMFTPHRPRGRRVRPDEAGPSSGFVNEFGKKILDSEIKYLKSKLLR
jgi:hypothetical protein